MPKFRKKPVVVEAVQLDLGGKHRTALPDGVTCVTFVGGADNYNYQGLAFFVRTIHGDKAQVRDGDWIVTEPDGVHHYPCKPDIFDATYEPVMKCPKCGAECERDEEADRAPGPWECFECYWVEGDDDDPDGDADE